MLPLIDLFPGEDLTRVGLFVTAGDIDGDGKDELIVTPDNGGGARVPVKMVDDFYVVTTAEALRAAIRGYRSTRTMRCRRV